MDVSLFLHYKPSTVNDGVITDFSKIRSAIAEKLNTNGCLDLSFVNKAYVSSVEHPFYIVDNKSYAFTMKIYIEYWFASEDP